MNIKYLVKKARKGNEEAFQQLVASVRQKLYQTAYFYVKNEQDALDLYQDTIYEAYLSLEKLRNPEQFQSWITRILVFKAIDFIRKSSKQFIASEDVFSNLYAEAGDISIEQSIDLAAAFDLLEPTYRTIILLRYYHDLSIRDIAELLNSPEGTVKSKLSRAKQALRPILKEGYLYE